MEQAEARLTTLLAAVDHHEHPGRTIQRLLASLRVHLDMDAVFLSEFADGQRVFRFVDGDLESFDLSVGAGDPLETTYCQRVMEGVLPSLIPDARTNPATRGLEVTTSRNIGCYIGVPVRLSDDVVFGTLCCLAGDSRNDVSDREVALLRVLAELVAEQLEQDEAGRRTWRTSLERIRSALEDPAAIAMHFQPIVSLDDGRVLGLEALARFRGDPARPPNEWFDEAWSVGLGAELELAAIRAALAQLPSVPPDAYLAVNLSHETLLADELEDLLATVPLRRLVVELTEHARVADYLPIRAALDQLRTRGVRLAIDDWGAGYSGLHHVLELQPEIVKIDLALVRDITTDRVRHAAASGLATFGRAAGATIVAEGIETQAQLDELRRLGIHAGQGYHFARPGPLPPGNLPSA